MFECALGMQYLHEVRFSLVYGITFNRFLPCRCQRGITHGNLKPTNILVTESGQACVADYGMIDTIRSGGAYARYLSPEAWKGVRHST